MSTLTDKAKAEAEEVEREQEEEEAAEVEEAAPEPTIEDTPEDAAPALTEVQAEREIAKLEKAATAYMGKAFPIAQALGMPVQPCPLCAYPGLAMPRQAHEVTSDVEGAIYALIGKAVEPEYRASQAYIRCEACDGWGDVLTGAQKDISRTAMCVQCGGKGYVNNVQAIAPVAPTNVAQFPGATTPYTPLPNGVPDQWNRPAGHPHWGLDPASVGA